MNVPLILASIAGAGVVARWIASRAGFPVVAAYLLVGIGIGPLGLRIITETHLDALIPLTSIMLAFVMLMVGRELNISRIRNQAHNAGIITLVDMTVTLAIVTASTFKVIGSTCAALLLGITALPTAPAAVMSILHQYTPRGPFTRLITSAVILNEVIAAAGGALVITSVARWYGPQDGGAAGGHPLQMLLVLLTGTAAGLLLVLMLPHLRDYGHRSAAVIGATLSLYTLSPISLLAPPFAALVAGGVIANGLRYSKAFWHRFEEFLDYFYLMFFVYLGAHLQPALITRAPGVLAVYMLARGVGKYIGGALGCVTISTVIPGQKHIGLALMPQGALALILAAMAEKISPLPTGLLLNVVLTSTLFFELLGPFGTAFALRACGESHDIHRRSRGG